MTRIRLRVGEGSRFRDAVLHGREFLIGRSEQADVRIEAVDAALEHARLLVRRNRLILASLGAPIERRGDAMHAPVVLDAGEPFVIAGVTLAAYLADDDPLADLTLDGFKLGTELYKESDHRRVEAQREGCRGEALVCGATDELWTSTWQAPARAAHQVPEILSRGTLSFEGKSFPYLIEGIEEGVRLEVLFEKMRQKEILPPSELSLLVLAQIAEALVAYSSIATCHGGLDPTSVHLGESGTVWLLRPGPRPDGYARPERRAFLSPARRYGAPPSPADDRYALGVLIQHFLELERARPAPMETGILGRIDAIARSCRQTSGLSLADAAAELFNVAQRGPLDPSRTHVARIARLLALPKSPVRLRAA